MDIISAYQQLGSYRAAADACGTTHRTVKKVIDKFEADRAGVPSPPRAERSHNYDAVADLVAERVEKSQGRISAKRLLPIAEAAGYEGSARNFRRLVADAKALWRSSNHSGRRPAVWSPGQYLVIDWAQAAPGLFLFCAVLAFSRWRFVRFATDQKASTTLALIAEALAAIGGVPARVLAAKDAARMAGAGSIRLVGSGAKLVAEVSETRHEIIAGGHVPDPVWLARLGAASPVQERGPRPVYLRPADVTKPSTASQVARA